MCGRRCAKTAGNSATAIAGVSDGGAPTEKRRSERPGAFRRSGNSAGGEAMPGAKGGVMHAFLALFESLVHERQAPDWPCQLRFSGRDGRDAQLFRREDVPARPRSGLRPAKFNCWGLLTSARPALLRLPLHDKAGRLCVRPFVAKIPPARLPMRQICPGARALARCLPRRGFATSPR